MAQDVTAQDAAAQRTPRVVLVGACAVTAALFACAVALWSHYGTTVFFEMIRAGFAACF